MGWLDWLPFRRKSSLQSDAKAPPQAKRTPRLNARALAGGRVSIDKAGDFFAVPGLIATEEDPHNTWSILELDTQSLLRATPQEIVDLLVEISPEMSRAVWDFVRMCNPGWTCEVKKLGGDDPDEAGEAAAKAFLDTLKTHYGSADWVFNRMILSSFLRGALCAELILDKRGRIPVDLATPDPASIRFKQVEDPVRGKIWIPGQYQDRDFVPLDIPTFRYIGVDTIPGKAPYGRSLANPAIFVCVFLIALLHDLRRVVQQQGYPRLDVEIDLEALAAAFPDIAADVEKFQTFIEEQTQAVVDNYGQLEPDDAYIHSSVITVNRPVGAVDASSLGAIDGLIQGLERQAVRALKTMPMLFGITDGVSEANANRQWEIHAKGIKSIQHLAESLLERLLEVALQAQGIQADVCFRFAELRAAEELRDQQTLTAKIANYGELISGGFVSRDEASMAMVGHAPDLTDEELEKQKAERLAQFAAAQQANATGEETTTPQGDGEEQAPEGNADPGSERMTATQIRAMIERLERVMAPFGGLP